MDISTRLQEERKRLGLTQEAVAAQLGATKRSVINWEGGAALPGAEVLARYAAAGADVLYVLTGERSSAQPAHDAAEQVLLDSYRRCGAQARQNLIQTAALLAAGVDVEASAGVRQAASIKVSSKHGHAAGRDVNVKSEESNGKGHKPQRARRGS
ncbi:MAG: XRE family transcriptional regulator [Burkholderiaceae bacterium]|nr:MAG: XRE family transcriptional regulator [Burkholderiaceae bacterium]